MLMDLSAILLKKFIVSKSSLKDGDSWAFQKVGEEIQMGLFHQMANLQFIRTLEKIQLNPDGSVFLQ